MSIILAQFDTYQQYVDWKNTQTDGVYGVLSLPNGKLGAYRMTLIDTIPMRREGTD